MHFRAEPTAFIGTAGLLASLTLGEINLLVSLLVGLATLLFVSTRWLILVRRSGGFAAIFWPKPSPVEVRQDNRDEPPRSQ